MVILALETATRRGSLALFADGAITAGAAGDARRTHGERLPGEITTFLAGLGRSLRDVDCFAVVSGPGGRQVLVADPAGNLVELFQPAG